MRSVCEFEFFSNFDRNLTHLTALLEDIAMVR